MINRYKTFNYLLSTALCILFVKAATTIKAPNYPLKNGSKKVNFEFLEIIIKLMCLNQQLSTNCLRRGLVASPLLPVLDSLAEKQDKLYKSSQDNTAQLFSHCSLSNARPSAAMG